MPNIVTITILNSLLNLQKSFSIRLKHSTSHFPPSQHPNFSLTNFWLIFDNILYFISTHLFINFIKSSTLSKISNTMFIKITDPITYSLLHFFAVCIPSTADRIPRADIKIRSNRFVYFKLRTACKLS